MAQFPSETGATGVWDMQQVYVALLGGNWPSATPKYMGTITTTAGGGFWLTYSGGSLYAAANTASSGGTANIFLSTNSGVTWTTKGTVTGAGSNFGVSCLATAATTLIVQHRGYFYRSIDSGGTFSTLLTTSGGQNNFYSISTDGTNGICSGFNREVITTNNWSTCAAQSNPFGIMMSSCTLTSNGGNRFMRTGFGSSGSPTTMYIANATGGTTYYTRDVVYNSNFAISNPTTGADAIVATDGGSNIQVYYATWPSTTYSNPIMTGVGASVTGQPCISPQNRIVIPTTTGLWQVFMNGSSAPLLLSSFTDWSSLVSDGTTYVFGIRTNGEVYRITTA